MMEDGSSKINPPNSHPSNPIHKSVMAAQNPKPDLKTADGVLETQTPTDGALETQTGRETLQHEINKTALIVGVVGVVALIFIATRQLRLLMYFSKIKTTAARISSQVCSARYPIASPVVLKRNLTIAPISSFCPNCFKTIC